jgi:hypothetical protein
MPKDDKKIKGSPEPGIRGGNSHKMKELKGPFHPGKPKKVAG